jgi:hypothetical protein
MVERGVEERAVVDDAGDEPDALGLARVDEPAREHQLVRA